MHRAEPVAVARPRRGHARGPGGAGRGARRRAHASAPRTRGALRQLDRSGSLRGLVRDPVKSDRRSAVTPLAGLPEVRAGDDLAALIAGGAPADLGDGDIVVVAHKVVSKAEGRVRRLADVEPSDRARELAAPAGKDPRAVQVVLDETVELLRAERGVLICVTRHGFVCANAGVDASNAAAPDELILLPDRPGRVGPRAARGDRSTRAACARRWSSPTRSAAPGGWARPTWRSAPPG